MLSLDERLCPGRHPPERPDMGDDGAEAIRDVRSRGGRTIAESSQTAIIFGMPNEAIKTGCVDQVLAIIENKKKLL